MTAPETLGPVERALFLRSVPPFTGLRARPLAALAQLTREEIVPAGAAIVPLGRGARSVRFLVEGRLRARGAGDTTDVLEAPLVIGLPELLAGREVRLALAADADATILTIAGAALFDLLEEDFTLVRELRRELGEALAAAREARGDWAPDQLPEAAPAPVQDLGRFVDRMLVLHRVPMLRDFGVAVLATLLRDEPVRRLAAGETLFTAGEAAEHIAVIAEGVVVGTPANGAAFRAGAGTMLGDNEALIGAPYAYTAVCEEPAAIIALDPREIWDAADDHFHVARALLAACARSLLRLQGGPAGRVDAVAPPDPVPKPSPEVSP